MAKCVFLDRDGVLNEERGDWTYRVSDFRILPGVSEAVARLKGAGYLTVIITNQSAISLGLYSVADMNRCHDYLQKEIGHTFDNIYFAPYHPTVTRSLGRKPGSLLFERALALHSINPTDSWMVGDKERDLIPAKQLGMKCISVDGPFTSDLVDHSCGGLLEATDFILQR